MTPASTLEHEITVELYRSAYPAIGGIFGNLASAGFM
jgi:hypothetical protein